jgi:hypothetical protein
MAVTKKKRSFGAGVDWIAELSKLFDEGHYSTAADLYDVHARG